MKNIRKKVRFHFNLKSKHLLVIMTFFCGSCIVATAASGTSSAPLQEAAGFLIVPFVTAKIWNRYTSTYKERDQVQYQGIFQGFVWSEHRRNWESGIW